MLKRFILYLCRWQLSTPILWPVVNWLGAGVASVVVANLIGGAIFFWVDKFIFTSPMLEVWHYQPHGKCQGCGKKAELWRLVKAKDYDKTKAHPVFLCAECSYKKLEELKAKGIETSRTA
jgi:DNA-directed RNA polymerase subunit RPC12/RpoP